MLATRRWLGPRLVLMGIVLAGCGGNAPGSVPRDTSIGQSFAALLQTGIYIDYEVVESPAELRDLADLVIIGTISDVVEGRVLPYGRAEAQANLVIDVERVIRGIAPRSGPVYVEVTLPSGLLVSELASAAPNGRLVLFLGDRTYLRGTTGETGRPEGSAIYAPFAQGMVIEADQMWISGLVDGEELPPGWQKLESFDQLVATIED